MILLQENLMSHKINEFVESFRLRGPYWRFS